MKFSTVWRAVIAVVLASWMPLSFGGEVQVAVAANFTAAIQQLQPVFEHSTGHRLRTSFGSTGQLVAQIRNGAPFDVLLAADNKRFSPLLASGNAVSESDFIYASGRLALVREAGTSGHEDATAMDLINVLQQAGDSKIAIANPDLAPYGLAAETTLQNLGLYEALKHQLVMGQNIAQVHQFVVSGAAPLAFVALAQIKALSPAKQGGWWLVPSELHGAIDQQAMLLTRGKANPVALEFLTYLRSSQARVIIQRLGYSTPQ